MKRFYKVTLYALVAIYDINDGCYHRWHNWGEKYFTNCKDALKEFKHWNNVYGYKSVLRVVKKGGKRRG